ncbi:MAG: helix-turn-helix transcriptional regulator [bacterium]|nr:helix-turn-helix transcriptional regulator [bacterium]
MSKETITENVVRHILECTTPRLKEITIDDLARDFNISKTSLNRKFQQKVNTSPGRYILREKLMRAARLMDRRNGLTVKEVSQQLGFCTCDYFIQVFKSYYGIPPHQYRIVHVSIN